MGIAYWIVSEVYPVRQENGCVPRHAGGHPPLLLHSRPHHAEQGRGEVRSCLLVYSALGFGRLCVVLFNAAECWRADDVFWSGKQDASNCAGAVLDSNGLGRERFANGICGTSCGLEPQREIVVCGGSRGREECGDWGEGEKEVASSSSSVFAMRCPLLK